jgi:hypothetical protein
LAFLRPKFCHGLHRTPSIQTLAHGTSQRQNFGMATGGHNQNNHKSVLWRSDRCSPDTIVQGHNLPNTIIRWWTKIYDLMRAKFSPMHFLGSWDVRLWQEIHLNWAWTSSGSWILHTIPK